MEHQDFIYLKATLWHNAYITSFQRQEGTAEQARIDATNALEVFIKAVKEEHA